MDLLQVEERTGIVFSDKSLLMQALTHCSYLNEDRSWPVGHNERLEFLGDAVIELVVTEFLFKKFRDKSEGQLTVYRAALVCTKTNHMLASKLGLEPFIKMSRGESRDKGRAREVRLADAFEAFVGALYLDQGLLVVAGFLAHLLLSDIDGVVESQCRQDTKSRLQECAQRDLHVTPHYKVLEESGPDHYKQFTVGVFFGGDQIAKGTGFSKRQAEEEAAKTALEIKGWFVQAE